MPSAPASWTSFSAYKAAVKRCFWARMLHPIYPPQSIGSLHLISAGGAGPGYYERVQSIDWSLAYTKGFGAVLEQVRTEWKERYDFVLVDSRTGVSDVAGISTIQLPDQLVYLFTANRQSIDGASAALQTILASRQKMPVDREQMLALPVLSRFAQDKEYDLASRWMSEAVRAATPAFAPWLSRDVSVESLMRVIRIPEVAYWTFGERIPVLLEPNSASDPQSITYPMTNIAALVARGLADTEQLLLSRESYIASATHNQRSAKYIGIDANLVPVAISSSQEPRAQEFRRSLAAASAQLGIRIIDEQQLAAGQAWLKHLTLARILIVLLDDQITNFQSAEIEGFFSVTLRSAEGGLILPIALTPLALTNAPSLLQSFQFIDGGAGLTSEVLGRIEAAVHRVTATGSGAGAQ